MKVPIKIQKQDEDTGDVYVIDKVVDVNCPRCKSWELKADNLGMITCQKCRCTFRANTWGFIEIMTEGLSCHLCKRPINSKSFYVCQSCSDYTCEECVNQIKSGRMKGCA